VLTTPLLRALRTADPTLRLTVVASPLGSLCLTDHPGVDELITIDMQHSRLADKMALARRLRERHFDVAITVTEKAWGYLWAWLSGARRRIGFWAGATQPVKALLFRPTLTDRILSPNDPRHPSTRHEVERILDLLSPLGIASSSAALWLAKTAPASGATSPHATSVDPPTGTAHLQTATAHSRPIALHLSPKWLSDGWRKTWLEDLVCHLADLSPAGLRLSAGPAEAAWAAELAERLGAKHAVRPMGAPTFAAWCRALADCAALVTMDTGAVHVAAGVGIPVVDVFAREGNEHCVPRWKPWGVPHVVVLRDRGEGAQDPALTLEEILRASRSLLHDGCHVA